LDHSSTGLRVMTKKKERRRGAEPDVGDEQWLIDFASLNSRLEINKEKEDDEQRRVLNPKPKLNSS